MNLTYSIRTIRVALLLVALLFPIYWKMTDALTAVNTIGSGALASATGIAAGPAGSMLYVGLGAAFLLAIAGLVIYFIRQIKK